MSPTDFLVGPPLGLPLGLPLYQIVIVVLLFVLSYSYLERRLLLTDVRLLPDFDGVGLEVEVESESNGDECHAGSATPAAVDVVVVDQSDAPDSVDFRSEPSVDDLQSSVAVAPVALSESETDRENPPESETGCGNSPDSETGCGNPPESETDGVPLYFQVVFLGDSGVGKTSFARRYCSSTFRDRLPSTVCIDLLTKKTSVDGRTVVLHLWDTAGQERFRSVSVQYLRKADCILAVYDASSEESLLNVRQWLSSAEEMLGDLNDVVIGIVANKSDLLFGNRNNKRSGNEDEDDDDDDDDDGGSLQYVRLLEGLEMAKKLRAAFGVCSSKSGRGVVKFMDTVGRMLVAKWNLSPAENFRSPGKTLQIESERDDHKRSTKTFRCC